MNLVMQQISERSVNFDLPYLWEPCLSSIYNLYTYLYFLTITRVKNQVNEYKCISSNCFQKHNQILHTQKLIDLYKNIDTVKQGEYFFIFLIYFFSVRLLSVLRGHSFFSSPPQWPMTSDFEGFLYQILSITFFSYLNS